MTENTKLILEALKRINEDGKENGTVTCPKCGGIFNYVKSKRNGHIYGVCQDGCFSVQE